MKNPIMIMEKQCDQCLFSKRKIVSDERRDQIIRDCKRDFTHFECHKGTMKQMKIVCNGSYRKGITSQAVQLAERLHSMFGWHTIRWMNPKNL